MKTFIDRLLRNPVSFEITSVFVYAFYCLVFAMAAIPSVLLISWATRFLGVGHQFLFLFVFICFLAFYIFLVCSSVFVAFVERLLTLGLKPGSYPIGSKQFFRWLVYSGLHLWSVNIVLPFLRGNNWIKIYLRISGAKIGKQVFINTKHIYDAYLLEIEDNVFVGGDAFVNCHLFEGGSLKLGKIILKQGSSVGACAYLTPGTTAGKDSQIGMHTYLRRNTTISDGGALITPPGMSMRQALKIMRLK